MSCVWDVICRGITEYINAFNDNLDVQIQVSGIQTYDEMVNS